MSFAFGAASWADLGLQLFGVEGIVERIQKKRGAFGAAQLSGEEEEKEEKEGGVILVKFQQPQTEE